MLSEIKNNDEHSAEILAHVASKQVELVYNNQPFALFSTFMVVTVLMIVFLSSTNELMILGSYLMLFSVILSFRAYINWKYFKDRKNSKVNVGQAKTWYMFGIVLTSLAWCSLITSVLPILALGDQILLIITVLGVVAAAHTTMGYLESATVVHTSFLIAASLHAIYFSDFPNTNNMLAAIAIYFIFVMRSSNIFYNSTFNMLLANEFALKREVDLELQTTEANSANNKKSEFLSRMSHELRTPLNAVLGMNELLMCDKKEPLTEKQSNRAQKVDAAGKHLLSIVDDVLDLSRIEAGRVEVRTDLVSCQAVINESIRLVESKASSRNVTIHTDVPDEIVHSLADTNRVKQVLVNLIDNAVKYNKHGGMVTVMLEVKTSNFVRISVIDTGYGIPEYSLDDLFRPFSRLGAEELGIDGTGIGLNLCKQLIELMNGRIGVESRNGKGCCFWVELPYSEQSETISTKKCAETPEIYSKKIKEKKILLVEDNLVNCEVAIDMLDSMGFEADVVNDGQQAVDIFDCARHGLILMDCEMPVLDGFSATKKIRAAEVQLNLPRTPIIALTAHAITGARDKCLNSGMDDFLSKPFSMSALQLILNRWLQSVNGDEVIPATNKIDEEQVKYSIEKLTPSNNDLLDDATINRLSSRKNDDGTTLLDTVVNIYLKQSTKLLNSLTDATKQEDIESVKEIMHALKSSSSNVGAIELSALCEQLEANCECGQLNSELIDQVHGTYSLVKSALNEKLLSTRQ
jgi:signal transduction histidine kinase/CheY-like chemotaxis protein/HPt (histidine-containing phosphotransfer) domain-containing protein